MVKKFRPVITTLLSAILFSIASVSYAATCTTVTDLDAYTDNQLQAIYDACTRDIDSQKKELQQQQVKTQSLSKDLATINAQVTKSQAYINARQIEIFKINKEISNQKKKIVGLEYQIDQLKEAIADLIRKKHELDDFSFVEAIFSTGSLSDFFVDWNNYEVIRERLGEAYIKLAELKGISIEKTEELSEEEARERELKAQKEREAKEIERKRADQKLLLAIAKEEEVEYQRIIKQKESLKNEIRSKLFRIADGGQIAFGDALALVRPYEKSLGLDAAFILSVLFQESGWNDNIGGNIGQCYYNQIHSVTKKTVMSPTQTPAFLSLMEELGRSPGTQRVSCPIARDGSYGGAMGPAQFMPLTWASVKSKVAATLGKSTVSPFVNQDAFIASGLYLKDLYYSEGCTNYANQYSHISPKQTLRERCAAAKYYAGGNWWNYRFQYGESVVKRADKFRDDIETLGL